MGILDYISRIKSPKFTFKDHYGKEHTMRATDIHYAIMKESKESDYDWIAPAMELVKICKNENFPREYAVDIEIAILNCFANIEARVNRGGDKYITKADNALAVQYCYDELGRLAQSTDDKELQKTLISVRTRYLKEMISSAVNTAVRGDYIYCDAYGKLKEKVIGKYFTEYSTTEENFNILDMYEAVSDGTEVIFKRAYESGMFKQSEEESKFCLVKMCNEDAIFYPKKATFKGNHAGYNQGNLQPSNEEDILSK